MDSKALNELLYTAFPNVGDFGQVTSVSSEGDVTFRLIPQTGHIRPGGTVSGPTMMTMVDTAAWCALLHKIGPQALAVTTNLNINFLRKPSADEPLDAIASLLKLGKRLAICEVRIEQGQTLVAHSTCTYSIPPNTPQ